MTYNPTAAWDRGELDRLRAENKGLRHDIETIRDTLEKRTAAHDRTVEDKDRMRATLERVKKLADEWESDALGTDRYCAAEIRLILDDKEPTP